ncbi:MAG: disulfide bond formation protein B [Thermoanaerobaculia bacterium]|nr:disulfide bond formation protein B [Thermoanaerobaculia bacterium]
MPSESRSVDGTRAEPGWALLFAAWLLTAVAAAGSLFFSYVMGFAPCVLCWYQRICLFPLVLILARGLFPLDRSVVKYALPLTVVGWLFAGYHNLIYFRFVPESLSPCAQGVSCSEEYVKLLGFLSIPMMSWLAFTITALLLVLVQRRPSS